MNLTRRASMAVIEPAPSVPAEAPADPAGYEPRYAIQLVVSLWMSCTRVFFELARPWSARPCDDEPDGQGRVPGRN